MKTGRSVEQVKGLLKQYGYYENAKMVQNCGLEQEHIFQSLDEATNEASYFSIIVCKEAVSYTHLDVYKRQIIGIPLLIPPLIPPL